MKFGITLFILFSSLFVELSVHAENLPPNPPSIGNLEKSNEKKEEINNKQKEVSNPESEKKINPDLPTSTFSSQKPDQKENEKNTIYPDGYKKEEKKETPKHIDFYGEEKKQPDNLEKEKIKSEKKITTPNESKKENNQKTVVNEKVNSTWINNSINNLDKIGDLKVPAWIDYNSFIGQKDFSLMLLRVTKINNKDFFGELDQNNLDKTISRGLAFDSAIKAFGLEKEMQRIGGTYRRSSASC